MLKSRKKYAFLVKTLSPLYSTKNATMKLQLGFSPCPNDTFIFHAMVNNKIDLEGLSFDFVIEDVAELNRKAFEGALDVTKISYHALGHLIEKYVLLHTGSALGNNCGPLVISKDYYELLDLPSKRVAIPGRYTTANFLLDFACPGVRHKEEMLFSEIEDAILEGKVDAGVIIHENRFTYSEKGLYEVADLGAYWEKTTNFPIPLGGIAIKRSIDPDVQRKVNRIMGKSVQYAFTHSKEAIAYAKQYAQTMKESVMRQHIALYVNYFTMNLGMEGREAIEHMYKYAVDQNIIPEFDVPIFIRKL